MSLFLLIPAEVDNLNAQVSADMQLFLIHNQPRAIVLLRRSKNRWILNMLISIC